MTTAHKVLFFCVTSGIPTAEEQAIIDTLSNRYGTVGVRAGDVPTTGALEPADGLAGAVPQEYMDAIDNYPLGVVEATPVTEQKAALMVPDVLNLVALATAQLYAVVSEFVGESFAMSNKTAGEGVSYSSSNEGVATVDAAGVVTGVAAGSAAITWRWTYQADPELFIEAQAAVAVA